VDSRCTRVRRPKWMANAPGRGRCRASRSNAAPWRLQSTKERMDQQSSPDLRGQRCGNACRRSRGRPGVTQEELSSLFNELAEAIDVTSGGAMARSSAELRNNVQWVSRLAKEKPGGDQANPAAGRTNNRIRSPRQVAFSPWKNVGKGSRQNGCVTSEEALAPRA